MYQQKACELFILPFTLKNVEAKVFPFFFLSNVEGEQCFSLAATGEHNCPARPQEWRRKAKAERGGSNEEEN